VYRKNLEENNMNRPDFSNINLNLDAPKISKEEWQAKVEAATGKSWMSLFGVQ
jgi:hypothetical protein